jgi:cysteine desulfurase/selenocysteine lyase
MIYLDNAATSWPKPPEVAAAMADFLTAVGGNPGRSGHRMSVAAGRAVYDVREALAAFFGAPDPLRLIFTANATHALNLALRGLLHAGDRVVTSAIEHNGVMRPLRALEREGVELTVVPCRADATLDVAAMRKAITAGTKMVVLNHASNVTGTILPAAEVGAWARRAGALFLVDAAQTAGIIPIDIGAMNIDLLAFAGHKGLLGPPGTGGLVIGDRVDVTAFEPLVRGGTGSRSESEEQPDYLPDKLESGTLNGVGIIGLGAGLAFIAERGLGAIREHERRLTGLLIEGLGNMAGIKLYGPTTAAARTAVVSFTAEGMRVSEVGDRLDEEFGIFTRVGLHCAPACHRTLDTFPEGTVRMAPGVFTAEAEVETAIRAVRKVAAR